MYPCSRRANIMLRDTSLRARSVASTHRALDAHLECANVPARYIFAVRMYPLAIFWQSYCLRMHPSCISSFSLACFLGPAFLCDVAGVLLGSSGDLLHHIITAHIDRRLSVKCGACSSVDWQRGQFGTLRMHGRAKLVCDDSCAGGYTHLSTRLPVGRVYGREADEHSLERSSWAPRQRCRSHAPASRATRPSVASRRTMISP